jgi:hypothetical protein
MTFILDFTDLSTQYEIATFLTMLLLQHVIICY